MDPNETTIWKRKNMKPALVHRLLVRDTSRESPKYSYAESDGKNRFYHIKLVAPIFEHLLTFCEFNILL